MQIQVLGSIEANNGSVVALGGPTQRRILAMLAMEAGDVVSLDRLVDATWPDEDIPAQAERNVRTYIHRLRTAFGEEFADRIETTAPAIGSTLMTPSWISPPSTRLQPRPADSPTQCLGLEDRFAARARIARSPLEDRVLR